MTPITCAKPSPPRGRSPSSPATLHVRSNIRSTSISMRSAISWNAASRNSSSSAASQPASKRPPEITGPSSLSQPSSYGCDKCPHYLVRSPQPVAIRREKSGTAFFVDNVGHMLTARHAAEDYTHGANFSIDSAPRDSYLVFFNVSKILPFISSAISVAGSGFWHSDNGLSQKLELGNISNRLRAAAPRHVSGSFT